MTLPGGRLRALAARWCSQQTMDRLIDPVIADLQAESELAATTAHKTRVWILGQIAFFKVVICNAAGQLIRMPHDDDRAAMVRAAATFVAIAATCTVLLTAVPYVNFVWGTHPHSAILALYLIPQALPLSIPVALTVAVFLEFRNTPSHWRARLLVVVFALLSCAMSFALLSRIIPANNQQFRVSLARHAVFKGPSELRLDELHQLLARRGDQAATLAASDRRNFSRAYYTRWALVWAPLALSTFALALVNRRRRGRLASVLVGFATIAGYYALMYAARQLEAGGTLPPAGAAWGANVVFFLLTLVLMRPAGPWQAAHKGPPHA